MAERSQNLQDLFLNTAYGPCRLLVNEVGSYHLSNNPGFPDWSISLAATALDVENDGDLDLFLCEAMSPVLLAYPEGERPLFNAFDLPDPFKPRKIEPTRTGGTLAPDPNRRKEPLEAYPLEALALRILPEVFKEPLGEGLDGVRRGGREADRGGRRKRELIGGRKRSCGRIRELGLHGASLRG